VERIPTIPEIAEVLLLADPQAPWSNEGACRHLIRQHLCLNGWRWKRADREARRLIANGRNTAGIRMPRGWDVNTWPGVWPECWVCGKPFSRNLPWQHYCSELCH